MKRFVFILFSLLCLLSVQAQVVSLDKAAFCYNTVVPQHDVGTVIETSYTNIYTDVFSAPVMVMSTTTSNYFKYAPTVSNTSTTVYTGNGYTSGYYQRDVGWTNNNVINYPTTYITSTTQRNTSDSNYKNIQKYYCY